MEDSKARQLMKQLSGTYLQITMGESLPVVSDNPSNNWQAIPQTDVATMTAVVNRTYIDLAGYSIDDLTTFIQSVSVQHLRDPLVIGSAVTPLIWAYDFVTTRRITTQELQQLTSGDVPGYLPSTLDLMEMIYGEHRTYALNANIPGTFITTDTDLLGSGNPTTADRLHWTRVYLFETTGALGNTNSYSFYPANLVCQAITGKEKDLVYIERLRRAYTQQRSE